MAATILKNYEEQEDIAAQRYPLDESFFAAMLQKMACSDFNSKEYCICDIVILARYLGFRLSESTVRKPNPNQNTIPLLVATKQHSRQYPAKILSSLQRTASN
jgi:hypothetical protein